MARAAGRAILRPRGITHRNDQRWHVPCLDLWRRASTGFADPFIDASLPFKPESSGPTYEWFRTIALDIAPGKSRMMAEALRSANKPHTLIELPGEDHWLSQSESRIRVLTELESFLAAHLRGE